MPLQNRVTPFGEIIRTSFYGTLMGNRGVLHNDKNEIIKPFDCISWITCQLDYKNNHRSMMSPGKYTELFFLDEVTAFSAGHRPCALCRNADYKKFKNLWLVANANTYSIKDNNINSIDLILHSERINENKDKKYYYDKLFNLPDGTFVCFPENTRVYYLYYKNFLLRWDTSGYHDIIKNPFNHEMLILTPPSIVAVFKAGYAPNIHPSAINLIQMPANS